MSNYIVTTDFAAKDSLPSGNPAKVAKGSDVATELNNIATAITTKQDISSRAIANGYAPLDSNADVPRANLPPQVAYTDTANSFSVSQTFSAVSGQSLIINGVSGNYAASINNQGATGTSYGLYVVAGTNSSDLSFIVQNKAGANSFYVRGDGATFCFGSLTVIAGGLSVTGGATFSNTVNAVTFAGSGASLTSLPAGQLTGVVPAAVLGSGSGTSKWLYWNGGSPAWVQPSFVDILSTISSAQVPSAAVTQYQSSMTTRNISTKGGVTKTLQAGGSASGGADGDIIYIY